MVSSPGPSADDGAGPGDASGLSGVGALAAAIAAMDADGVGELVGQLAGLACGVVAQELVVIAELDRRQAWRADGQTSMASWLVMATGVSQTTARDRVRVARAVEDLPAVFATFAAGRLSWDQLVALTRLATPDSDTHWATEGPGYTASELARLARVVEDRSTADAVSAHQARGLSVRADRVVADAQVATLRLPAATMASVLAAVDRLADIDYRASTNDETSETLTPTQRRADALAALAGAAIAADTDPDRATVVVHASLEALRADPADPDGVGRAVAVLPDGSPLAVATLQRLACDARWQWVYQGADGNPLGVGRVTHTVPPWLRRHLDHRDGHTCRFPGCDRTLGLHAHHIAWWHRDHGATDTTNLVTLCGHHHHLVHEDGWHIHGNPDHDIVFTRPDHTHTLPTRPPGTTPHTRQRWKANGLPPPWPPGSI